MKKKGQISIEFLFVVVYFVVLIGATLQIADHFVDRNMRSYVLFQEQHIANSVANIMTASESFDSGNYEVEYKISQIHIQKKPGEIGCNIEIRSNRITVETTLPGDSSPTTTEIEVNLKAGTSTDITCGENLRILG